MVEPQTDSGRYFQKSTLRMWYPPRGVAFRNKIDFLSHQLFE